MEKVDRKYYGTLRRFKDRSNVDMDQTVVFLAQDNAFPETLKFYREHCEEIGTAPEFLEIIDGLIERVNNWRDANPEKCKIPD